MPQAVEEEDLDIRVGLLGSPEEVESALRIAYEKYRRRVTAFARHLAPGLDSGELADVMQETFISLYRAARYGNFDAERPLLPFLLTLTRCRTIDTLRKYTRRVRNEEQFATDMATNLASTDAGYEWNQAVIAGSVSETQSFFRAFVATLPPVQRRIAQVMADHLPGDLTEVQITEIVYERTGVRPTVVQVKSAKSQIRMKFKAILNKASNTKKP